MKYIFLFTIVLLSACSLNNTDSFLKEYYNKNIQLHQALANKLMDYANSHKTEITMRRSLDRPGQIYFGYYFQTGNIVRLIKFDTSLNRIDTDPEYTSQIEVPVQIIKLFRKSGYTALTANSNEVFFGYKDSGDGNSKYGIVIDRDTADNSKKHIQKLANNVYITRGIIP